MNTEEKLEPKGLADICEKLDDLTLAIDNIDLYGAIYGIVSMLKPIAHANSQNLIPDGITYIGDYAFAKDGPDDYGSIKYFIIPKSVKHIGKCAFANEGTDGIEVDPANEHFSSIDGVLFNKDCTELLQYPLGRKDGTYMLPDSVVKIADSAFHNCKMRLQIIIPKGTKERFEKAVPSYFEMIEKE